MSEGCDVCWGSGVYPIHNRYGQEVYSITCPECGGQPTEAERAKLDQIAKYNEAMAEKWNR